MSLFNYSKFKILIDPESKKTQGLAVGDLVRRQYIDSSNLIYSLMLVVDTGVDSVMRNGESLNSYYFIGILLDGDEPKTGELLDFVRVSNFFNKDRSGALYLTSSDSQSPFMDVIDEVATNKSLCYPFMAGGEALLADPNKYTVSGMKFLDTTFSKMSADRARVFRITRNNIPNSTMKFGLKQIIERSVKNPQRVIISYYTRSSKPLSNVPVVFGYTNNQQSDGFDIVNIDTSWEYKVSIISIDFPEQYSRSLSIDLTLALENDGDWIEISDLNIVLLSEISSFASGVKARVGKISGIVDPVFGLLDGYGAYFQNLYATKNVNVAGTLTAGDENGAASTFYVGRIHKNVLINSIDMKFLTNTANSSSENSPTGIGGTFFLASVETAIKAQTKDWLDQHIDSQVCFSFWCKSNQKGIISVQQGYSNEQVSIDITGEWVRYSVVFVLSNPTNSDLIIKISNSFDIIVSSAQLEFGGRPSLYQATDDKLNYTDEYGAWFNRGGIGGTIQNPLLQLNADGSIASSSGSFVINADGSGYLANGSIKWNKDKVELGENVILQWGNLSPETQDNLKGEDGGSGYRIEKRSSPNSEFYREGAPYSAKLEIIVFLNEEDITTTINIQRFVWNRVSENPLGDPTWNDLHANSGYTIDITECDLAGDTSFICFFKDTDNNRTLTTKF